jgi:hypothetical protein
MLSFIFKKDVCGGDIHKKVVITNATKFIPILVDKYCDYAFKVKDKTFFALKEVLDHPLVGIGHTIDYIMNVTYLPKTVEATNGKMLFNRLTLFKDLVDSFGMQHLVNHWEDFIIDLCVPSMYHSSAEAR